MQDQLDIFGEMAKITQSFYNTIELSGIRLKEANKKAAKQEDKVLEIFRSVGTAMSAEEAWRRYNDLFTHVPIGSIRRACTNLCNAPYNALEILPKEMMIPGMYGTPIHLYKLIKSPFIVTNNGIQ